VAIAIDEHLRAIARAAEAGLECPPVRVVLAGGLVAWGVPRSAERLLDAAHEPLVEQYEEALRDRPKAERRTEHLDAAELAQQHIRNIRWPGREQEDEPDALTLLDVLIWPVAGGDGLQLPGLRVPLSAVQAWWIAGGGHVPDSEASRWFIGGIFPLESDG
jgi:hypothetical protein